jgi:hypothetical protein
MDVIWTCAVSMDINCQHEIDNPYVINALNVFRDLEHLKFTFILTSIFYIT